MNADGHAQLALLGAPPAFADGLAFVRPPVPPREAVFARLADSYDRGMLTNGPLVRELEAAMAERLGVAHVVAMSSCTIGLMLVFRVLDVDGPVLLPSFTFSASAHAVAWNGLACRFAECDPDSFQLDLGDAKQRCDGVGAILATHVFGAPCRPEEVEDLGASAQVPVVFDAAHALGSRRGSRPIGGFGVAEVFSMTPTKPVVAGEGGLVATNDAALAEALRMGRDYGNPGNYDTQFVGLNGRMSELHAAVALCSLDGFDEHLARRHEMAARYRAGLTSVPGVRVQAVDAGDSSTYKDFTVAIDPAAYGVDRDTLVLALKAEGVDTRNYFDPPVHRQRSHADGSELPVTDRAASQVVSLPIYPALDDATIDRVVEIVAVVHTRADQITAATR
ncbi:MAG TPA: DegT/DnrJ/EryC1/StrS family aminotransferase [Acidimicrobiia bacterium]